jgi:hypothetical protein
VEHDCKEKLADTNEINLSPKNIYKDLYNYNNMKSETYEMKVNEALSPIY